MASFGRRPRAIGDGEEGGGAPALSELIGQRKEAGEIVYRWFRFRARRGLGVFYLILSFLPVLGTIVGTLSSSTALAIVSASVGVVFSWLVARSTGLQSFGRMRSTIGLLKGSKGGGGRGRRGDALFLFIVLWPWVAFAWASMAGTAPLEVLFAVVWFVELVAYRLLTLRRNTDPIVDHRMEDWLVLVSLPAAALLSTVQIPGAQQFYGFMFLSPILLFSGLKSLYDAPKELVTSIDPVE